MKQQSIRFSNHFKRKMREKIRFGNHKEILFIIHIFLKKKTPKWRSNQEEWERSMAFNSRLSSLPVDVFGMESMKTTPAFSRLCGATFESRKLPISSCEIWPCPSFLTTYARGNSPAISSGTPITATSNTAGWLRKTSSNSDGETLNSKFKVVTSFPFFSVKWI